MSILNINRSWIQSPCRQYRYELRRQWDASKPFVLFIGINPSEASDIIDDNTSRVCMNFAKSWLYGGIIMGNLFAHIAKDQSELFQAENPVGAENDDHLRRMQDEAGLVICAWGQSGNYQNRDKEVLSFLKNPHCLQILKGGQPGHPLYKRADLKPIPFKIET